MGRDLFERFELAREIFSMADQALDLPLSEICFNGPVEKLTLTEIAQPAILTVSIATYRVYQSLNAAPLKPVAALGHSLGEYSALVAAGVLDFRDAVKLVNKRGRYMQEAVAPGAGRMVAVLGKEREAIEEAINKVTKGIVQIANVNAPGQIVVAGGKEAVGEFVTQLGTAKVVELNVSAPFHCALMRPAADKLALDLDRVTLNQGSFPVYANYNAAAVRDPESVRTALKEQVCGKVEWVKSIENALQDTGAMTAVEFGAGNVLSGLLKRINGAIQRITINSADAVTASSA